MLFSSFNFDLGLKVGVVQFPIFLNVIFLSKTWLAEINKKKKLVGSKEQASDSQPRDRRKNLRVPFFSLFLCTQIVI